MSDFAKIVKITKTRALGMMTTMILKNWQQYVFGVVGLAFLAFAVYQLLFLNDLTSGATVFGMAVFSLFYSNISRFKRFKGLGFEAELWEETQEQADKLVDRLQELVEISSKEIMLGRVRAGRWGSGQKWKDHWRFFEEIRQRNTSLNPKSNFDEIKEELDRFFIMDVSQEARQSIALKIRNGKSEATNKLRKKFNALDFETNDLANASMKMDKEIENNIHAYWEIPLSDNPPRQVLLWCAKQKQKLAEDYGTIIEFDPSALQLLEKLSKLVEQGPLKITDDLLELAPDVR